MKGANFTPSTAINRLEMWQAATFDPATFDRELGWAEGIGFNTMRVFLHDLAWQQHPGDPASRDPATFVTLRPYVTDALTSFTHDKHIVICDLHSEPGSSAKGLASLPLLRNGFAWAECIARLLPLWERGA